MIAWRLNNYCFVVFRARLFLLNDLNSVDDWHDQLFTRFFLSAISLFWPGFCWVNTGTRKICLERRFGSRKRDICCFMDKFTINLDMIIITSLSVIGFMLYIIGKIYLNLNVTFQVFELNPHHQLKILIYLFHSIYVPSFCCQQRSFPMQLKTKF